MSQLTTENERIYESNKKLQHDLQTLEDSVSADAEAARDQIATLEKRVSHMASEREDFLSELVVLRDTRDQMRRLMMEFQEADTTNRAKIGELEGALEKERTRVEDEGEEWRKLCDELEAKLDGKLHITEQVSSLAS